MSERIVSTRASIGEYRFRYLVVGCVALMLTSFALVIGYWAISLDIVDALRRTVLGFGLGSMYVAIVCGYHIALFQNRNVVHTHPLTPLGGVLTMLVELLFLGPSVLLALGFLSGGIVGYFMLTAWERMAKKKVLVVSERLVRSELRVVDGDVRVVYIG
ncbi:hypothetical protein [Methermicoccus shengliensis]|uniref:Uncharacterized protein n=1 Tax=Methermicoccus shengliensis TaxID=660064 RepID=A0A832VWX7_9EURY|nr:hypothetical protein [Methermicoccus shengliensis]KUK05055.1 MAG: hypothetical protein XD46_0048 [Euryarchaeota archaeon 55_53]KUK30348.1 MAG: hypothetical protein XD62_0523 [Methanosarcinales archeaon 56_1174]MDI3487561.1 hypothetical protein [Methanosarcinales archaeon]MDN5294710.1 hypothetical protein [Methanosarcinales archaeon]HIH69422.1 hypothetical protein [Methermicoccus shengliensis]